MGANKPDIDDAMPVNHDYNHSVVVAFDIEHNSIVSQKTGIAVNSLDVMQASLGCF